MAKHPDDNLIGYTHRGNDILPSMRKPPASRRFHSNPCQPLEDAREEADRIRNGMALAAR